MSFFLEACDKRICHKNLQKEPTKNVGQELAKRTYKKRGTRLAAVILSMAMAVCLCAGDFLCVTAYADETTAASESANAANSSEASGTWPKAPELYSEIAILMDADTGAILYEKNAHQKAYPASTTKLMTGLLTVENCNLDEIVHTSYAAASSVGLEDSNIGAKVGEKFTVEQCLYALLVHSANEIAYALAEHIGGDLPSFVMMMNMRAEELGALNTHFNNASGLHDIYHYTTAYDLAMIGRACLNNATFVSFDSYAGYYIMSPTNKTSVSRTLIPRNEMLKGGDYYYEYCKGGKTGFTDQAMYTLVTFAEKNGVRLIAVVLRSGKNKRFEDCTKLFEYGFSSFTKHTPSEADISTFFGKSNYFNSNVFGNDLPAFHISSTTLQLPTGVSSTAVRLQKDSNNNAGLGSGSDFSSKVQFVYNDGISDYVVGTATLSLDNSTGDSNLPYAAKPQNTTVSRKFRPTVNVWLILAIIAGGILLYCGHNWFLNSMEMSKRKRRWK